MRLIATDGAVRHRRAWRGVAAPVLRIGLRPADLDPLSDRVDAVLRHDDPARAVLHGRLEVVAGRRVLAPGFIDVHTHDDTPLIAQPEMAMKASQSVTTVGCGHCGASAAPVLRPEVLSALRSLTTASCGGSRSRTRCIG